MRPTLSAHGLRSAAAGLLTVVAALLLLALAPWGPEAASGQAADASVLHARADGAVTPVMADHLEAAIDEAERRGAAALLVGMDTPGGLESSMRDIVQDLFAAEVPVIVYVSPAGARAASAGAVIAYAAHVAVMAPGTNIGAATPVSLEGGEVIDKVIEDSAAYVTAIAEKRGRDVGFIVDAVREGRSAPAGEAAELGAVDLVVPTERELLEAVDGRTVRIGAEERAHVLETAGAELVTYDLSLTRRLLQALANPNLAFIFMSLGTLGVLFELANPGTGFGGILGGILLVLAFFSLAVLPIDLVGVILLVLALALFAAELFVPGVGVLAGGGAVALVLAGLFMFERPTGVSVDLSVLIPVAVVAGLGALLIGRLAWRSQRAAVYSGQAGTLVGSRATVRSTGSETVHVWVAGALWRARSDHRLEVGQQVRIIDAEGLVLTVEPAEEGEAAPGHRDADGDGPAGAADATADARAATDPSGDEADAGGGGEQASEARPDH